MLLTEKEVFIPAIPKHVGLLGHLSGAVLAELEPGEIPVRFVVTRTTTDGYFCELGTLSDAGAFGNVRPDSIFEFRRRRYEHADRFNAALLIPTGIGARLGGHSGDAGAVARLLAAACDTLITHPNVVNASDINELPENGLYVEGSVISRLLGGSLGLQPVRANRVMVVIDDHDDTFFTEAVVNSVSAARAAMGVDCPVVVRMHNKILMRSLYSRSGRAVGRVEHLQRLCRVLHERRSQYDAVAISSLVQLPLRFYTEYFRDEANDMINPWGGVEAMLTHAVSLLFDVPSAHSPMDASKEVLNTDVGIVDPRKSAEAVSTTHLHCVLRGLHRSPRLVPDAPIHASTGVLTAADVSCLVIPDGCVGLPTLAALEQGIPVIAVRENKNCMQNDLTALPFAPGKLIIVENYLEAAGVMTALRAGVAVETVRRPIRHTIVSSVATGNLACENDGLEDASNMEDDAPELETSLESIQQHDL